MIDGITCCIECLVVYVCQLFFHTRLWTSFLLLRYQPIEEITINFIHFQKRIAIIYFDLYKVHTIYWAV